MAGALIVAGLNNVKHKGQAALLILTLLGGITMAFAGSKVFWVSCVILFLGGAALVSVFALVTSLVQLQATDEMRGREIWLRSVSESAGSSCCRSSSSTDDLTGLFWTKLCEKLSLERSLCYAEEEVRRGADRGGASSN